MTIPGILAFFCHDRGGSQARETIVFLSQAETIRISTPPFAQKKQTHQPTRLFVSQLHRTTPARGSADLGGTGSSGRVSRGLLGGLLGLGGGGGLVLLGGIGAGLGLGRVRRSPQGEVVTEELHDEGAVAVRLLGQRVELGNGVVKGLLGKMASAVGRVEDLVVEDGEVEGKT